MPRFSRIDQAQISELVNKIKEKNGWSTSEMARQLKIPRTTLFRLLNGKGNVAFDSVLQITKQLGIKLYVCQNKLAEMLWESIEHLTKDQKIDLLRYLLKHKNLPKDHMKEIQLLDDLFDSLE